MKKISISQLPLGTTLKGLFTLGTDENNNSVKVSLTFVQDAADNANKATSDANTATNAANKATSDANTATNAANKAASDANKATSDAIEATNNANKATSVAIEAETARRNSWAAWFEDVSTGVVAIWNKWFGDTKTNWNSFNTSANKAETARAEAETARNSAEIERAQAETNRNNAEDERAQAETQRNEAETARRNAETARNKAETSRVNAEKARAESETERQSAWAAWFEHTTTGVKAIWDKWFADTKTNWNSFNSTASQAESSRVSEYASLRKDIMEKTEAANNAANRVDESILDVSTEKDLAIAAAKNANDSATGAKQSTLRANAASEKAEEVINRAEQAVTNANNATDLATEKIGDMNTGLSRLEELEATLTAKDRQQPTAMALQYPSKITFGNTAERRIEATLSPAGTGKNVLFLSDNRSVQVMPDGFIRVLNPGKSFIHVIPTENTAIYQTVEIEVLPTPIRKVTSTAMRLTSSGAMRFN